MRGLDSTTDAMNMNLGKLREMVRDSEARHATVHGLQRVGQDWVTEQKQQQRSTMKLKKFSKMKSSVKGMHTYTYI